jgi:hypothetical protein
VNDHPEPPHLVSFRRLRPNYLLTWHLALIKSILSWFSGIFALCVLSAIHRRRFLEKKTNGSHKVSDGSRQEVSVCVKGFTSDVLVPADRLRKTVSPKDKLEITASR